MNENEQRRFDLAKEKASGIRAVLHIMAPDITEKNVIYITSISKRFFLALELTLLRGAVADGGVYFIEKEFITGVCHGALASYINAKATELEAMLDSRLNAETLCDMLMDADDDRANEILDFCEELISDDLNEFIENYARRDKKNGGNALKKICENASQIFFALAEIDGDSLITSLPHDESNDAWMESNTMEKYFKKIFTDPWKRAMEEE